LYRALQHIENLKVEVEQWLGGTPYTITSEFDPEGGENILWINALDHPPDDFSLIIGDCLHNLRSALDSLVYALAIAEKGDPLPEAVAKRVQFPITEDPKAFKDAKRRIKDISQGAQVEIEALQPYNRRSDDYTRDPLWILNALSNIDKHHLTHLTLFALASLGIGGNARFSVGRPWEAAAVRDGTRLFSFGARRDDQSRKVHTKFKIEGSIAFEGPVAQGADVFEILPAIRNDIMNEVLPRLAPFLSPPPH